jgi:hypothetical protein
MKAVDAKNFIFILAIAAATLTARFAFAQTSSDDAIAARIMPNIEHYSALRWYQENIAANQQGSPSQLLVDGYQAVRDGRTVYVVAGNVDEETKTLYTNMYILSYTQNASGETQDIFGQLLNNWTFNINVVKDGGSGLCYGLKNNIATTQACYTDYDCGLQSGNYCSSAKAKLTRDVRRLADLRTITDALENFSYKENSAQGYCMTVANTRATPEKRCYKNNECDTSQTCDYKFSYPPLAAGSYIKNKSISVWPSWQETLGQFLGATLPVDPLNSLWACRNNAAKDPAGDGTCWNDTEKVFSNKGLDCQRNDGVQLGSGDQCQSKKAGDKCYIADSGTCVYTGSAIPEDLETLGKVYSYIYTDSNKTYKVCADNEAMGEGTGDVYQIIYGDKPACF